MKKATRDLKLWMKINRFTPTTLAERLDLKSPSTVWEWNNNGRKPHPETMKKFTELIASEGKESFSAEEFFPEE